MTNISIKPATVEDSDLILKFIKDLADYEKLGDEVVADIAQVKSSLFGEKPQAECVIGYIDGEPQGFALFFHNYSTFLCKHGLYLEDLFVTPKARGFGLGKALLSYLARLAQERGCERLEWWVLDWNKPSIDFYKNLGAEPMEDWTVYRVTGKALENLANKKG